MLDSPLQSRYECGLTQKSLYLRAKSPVCCNCVLLLCCAALIGFPTSSSSLINHFTPGKNLTSRAVLHLITSPPLSAAISGSTCFSNIASSSGVMKRSLILGGNNKRGVKHVEIQFYFYHRESKTIMENY